MFRFKCFSYFILSLAILLLFIATQSDARLVSGVTAHNHSSATGGGSNLNPVTLNVSGDITSTKPCSPGFTRIRPNFCRVTDINTITPLTFNSATCTTVPAPAADALEINLFIRLTVVSNNGAAIRFTDLVRWDTPVCLNFSQEVFSHRAYEFSALTAGTVIGVVSHESSIALATIGGDTYLARNSSPTSSTATAVVYITGYSD